MSKRFRRRYAASAKAFTLIEIMVAVAILAMVITLCWSSFQGTFKTKAAVEAQSVRYRTVRLALDRLARDLSMAYLSQNEDTGQPERRTLFVGKRHFDIDEIRFSYFGHQRLYQDANECDTSQVAYYSQRDREVSGRLNLMRRETRRLQYLKIDDNTGETDIACDDVVKLKLDYWDARDKQWREEWVTNTADGQPDRLPSRVRITLTVHDERGREVPFQTEVRVAMQEPLNLKATDPQSTGSTGTGGNQPPQPNCGAKGQACCTTGTQCQPGLSCKGNTCG
jgi:type II secretion system protein J